MGRATLVAAIVVIVAARATGADYATDVRPILEGRCYECHGEKKQKGHLRLDSPEAIAKGGKSGPAMVAGDPANSPMYVRVSLPAGDDDRMPPEGDPLTKPQQDAILAWIRGGAGATAPAGAGAATPGIAAAPAKPEPAAPAAAPAKPGDVAAADAKPAEVKPTSAKPNGVVVPESRKDLPPPPDTDLDALAHDAKAPDAHALEILKGFGVWSRALSKNGALIELDYRSLKGPVTAEMLKPLETLSDNIVWLDFAGSGVTDRDLTHLRPLKRLQSLHLERTAITDKGLAELSGLAELRYLDLYGTKVSDAGLHQLEKLSKLQALYLWQTQATAAGGDALTKAIPGLTVTMGEDLPDPARPDDEGKGGKKKKKK